MLGLQTRKPAKIQWDSERVVFNQKESDIVMTKCQTQCLGLYFPVNNCFPQTLCIYTALFAIFF